jgi:hypothetical protein
MIEATFGSFAQAQLQLHDAIASVLEQLFNAKN